MLHISDNNGWDILQLRFQNKNREFLFVKR